MGIPETGWSELPPDPPKRSRAGGVLLLIALLVVAFGVIWVKWVNFEQKSASANSSTDIKFSILPGMLEITLRKGSLYPSDDPWRSYLASEQTCPGGERTDLPLDQQADVMECLVDYARQKRGLSTLVNSPLLSQTSLDKAEKIVRCDQFAHDACGDDPVADVRAAGYMGAWGENLYIGEGKLGAPRVALDGWLNSPEHRDNLFHPDWRGQGIAVMTAPKIGDYSNVEIWVNQFSAS
jgi:hypothetical protein